MKGERESTMTFPLNIDQFSANFGTNPLPAVLEALLAFQNSNREWYSWGFELDSIPRKALNAHVKEEVIPQLFAFGRDRNYSIYALWCYQDVPLEKVPVVYLNSEGEGSGVLANDLSEFLMLLACDEEPRFGVYSQEIDDEIEHSIGNQAFRTWIDQQYHLRVAAQPNEIVQNARLQHPALPLAY